MSDDGRVERVSRAMHEVQVQPGVAGRIPWDRLTQQHRDAYWLMYQAGQQADPQPVTERLNDRCGQCGNEPEWAILRHGDAVCSWACGPHLSAECHDLQRDFEVTELVVKHYAKNREIAGINRALRQIPDGR